MVTRTGIEPMLQPWKGRVLTAWPTGHYMVAEMGFEPMTCRVWTGCSSLWAIPPFTPLSWALAYYIITIYACQYLFENFSIFFYKIFYGGKFFQKSGQTRLFYYNNLVWWYRSFFRDVEEIGVLRPRFEVWGSQDAVPYGWENTLAYIIPKVYHIRRIYHTPKVYIMPKVYRPFNVILSGARNRSLDKLGMT